MAAGSPLTVQNLQSQARNSKDDPSNLAQRNLLRGMSMGLPSGQDVARSMGVIPVEDKDLRVGKAVVEDWDTNPTLASLDKGFEDNAPLWFYVLAEAQAEWIKRAKAPGGKGDEEPLHLGTVGGRIVAETLIGMLWADGLSPTCGKIRISEARHDPHHGRPDQEGVAAYKLATRPGASRLWDGNGSKRRESLFKSAVRCPLA